MTSSPHISTLAAAIALATLAIAPSAASAAASIAVGHHEILSNCPGQQLQIFITGGGAIQGVDLNVQIADGGPEAGGHMPGPKITSVDLLTGTIFANNNTGQRDLGSIPQLAIYDTTTSSGTVNADGLLATITLDTTDIFVGDWNLSLYNTLNGPTALELNVPVSIADGTLHAGVLVPEPAALAFALAPGALLARRCRRA